MMAKMRLEVVPAAGARSKLNETAPRAIFSDLIKSTNSRLVRSRVRGMSIKYVDFLNISKQVYDN